jgi:transposase
VIGIWINDAVLAYGTPLVEDPSRYGYVNALGLDETLFYRKGPYHNQNWCTTILDTEDATLLDVVPDKDTKKPKNWIANQPKDWRDRVTLGTLDLAGSYRAVFRETLPNAILVADPFHLVKVRHEAPWIPAVMKGHRLWGVAASQRS